MTSRAVPEIDLAVRLLRERFFTRTDCVALLAPGGKPFPCRFESEPVEQLDQLLRAHVLGEAVPEVTIRYRNKRGAGVARGRFRVGSYTPGRKGLTRWLCVDLDGKGHADALRDPLAAARRVVAAFTERELACHLERSGGGYGWHVWVLFDEPVLAKHVRALAHALLPDDEPLADGGVASPKGGRGIEVFPKQNRHRSKRAVGNMVWLPWWAGAPAGCSELYRISGDRLEPTIPTELEGVSAAQWQAALDGAGIDVAEAPVAVSRDRDRWARWRREALAALPLEAVYGSWLTGQASGEGWLECRDPSSASGDQNPSAGVADGSGQASRGAFHSFISGATISVFDFLIEHGGAADMAEATRRVAELSGVPPPSAARSSTGSSTGADRYPRMEIRVNDRQLRTIVAEAWEAMLRANASADFGDERPFLFQRGGDLVRLRTDTGRAAIATLGEHEVYGLLARVANWVRVGTDMVVSVPPVRDVARDMIAFPDPRVPYLEDVVTTPVFGRSGRLIQRPGYHADDRLWLQPDTGLGEVDVPARPAPEQVRAARALLLEELLVDFPFVADSDRAHAIAALLLPFVRRMIPGPTPLHLIEAPTAGSGKGLLSNLIALVATGAVCEARTLPGNDDEVRKMITAELGRGRPLILLDNADERRKLDSPVLASVLTTQSWTDRLLGQSRMLSLENRALWLLTANNPGLKVDMARRCVRIRIDPGVDRPWLRSGFRHEHPLEWAREHRGRLIHAVLVLIKSWIAADRPVESRRLGSFERWSGVIGGILAHAEIPGFLHALEDLYEVADDESQSWRAFTAAWWSAFEGRPTQVKALNELCEAQELMLRVRGDKGARSQQTRLGNALLRMRDRVFGGRRITRSLPQGKHRVVYALVEGDDDPSARRPCRSCRPSADLAGQGLQAEGPSVQGGCDESADLADLWPSPTRAHTRTHTFAHARAPTASKVCEVCEVCEEGVQGPGRGVSGRRPSPSEVCEPPDVCSEETSIDLLDLPELPCKGPAPEDTGR